MGTAASDLLANAAASARYQQMRSFSSQPPPPGGAANLGSIFGQRNQTYLDAFHRHEEICSSWVPPLWTSYRIIEQDAALARRFQSVYVEEPDVEDTVTILRGLKPHYELHHSGIRIKDEALVAAAN